MKPLNLSRIKTLAMGCKLACVVATASAAPVAIDAKLKAGGDTEKAISCAKVLSSLPELAATTRYEVGVVFSKPAKDQYEKQAAYETRSRQAFQNHQQAIAVKAQSMRGYRLVSPIRATYDAEKERFSISNPLSDASFDTGLNEERFLSFTVMDGAASERPMGLGAKARTSRWYGFALSVSSKDNALRRKNFVFKANPTVAKANGDSLGLAIAGKSVAPWVAESRSTSSDYGTLTETHYSTNTVVVDVLCAAIVNTKTLEVIQLLK